MAKIMAAISEERKQAWQRRNQPAEKAAAMKIISGGVMKWLKMA
jgi:hypothetical protein